MTAPIFSMIFISRQFTLQTVDLIHYNLVLSLFTDEEPESPRSVNKSEESVDPSDERNSAFIAVLHFTVTVGSSTMSITHTIK
jgi:hypothetical protein